METTQIPHRNASKRFLLVGLMFICSMLCVSFASAETNVTNGTWTENLSNGETINVNENVNLTFTFDSKLYNPQGTFSTASSGNLYPYGSATDGTYIWLSDERGKIYKYYVNGTYISYFNSPYSFGVTTDGNYIWVSNINIEEDSKVTKYDMEGNAISSFLTAEGSMTQQGITTDGTYIWVSFYEDKEIYKYWINGTYISSFDTNGVSIRDMEVVGEYMWLISDQTNSVYKYNINGTDTGEVSLMDFVNTMGIATNGTTFWINDDNAIVHKYVYNNEFISVSTSWFSWFVDGVSKLAGIGQNVFNWVFNLPSSNPSATVKLKTGDSLCYQESANVTNQSDTDGNCGLNYSGSYRIVNSPTGFSEKSYDGNWSYGANDAQQNFNSEDILYINYSIPNGFNSAIWVYKHGVFGNRFTGTIENITIPPTCLTNNPLQLKINFSCYGTISCTPYQQATCYNGSWTVLYGSQDEYFYEEAINWPVINTEEIYNISTNSVNPLVNITYPANGVTYNQDTPITQMNYSFSDATASVCKYNIDEVSSDYDLFDGTNVTITCGVNVSNLNINQTGQYQINLYADNVTNTNMSSSIFNYTRLAYNSSNVIYQCGEITSAGVYTINQTLTSWNLASTGQPFCIKVMADNITLNGNNKIINCSYGAVGIGTRFRDMVNVTVYNLTMINGGTCGGAMISNGANANYINLTNNNFNTGTISFQANGYLKNSYFNNNTFANGIAMDTDINNTFFNNPSVTSEIQSAGTMNNNIIFNSAGYIYVPAGSNNTLIYNNSFGTITYPFTSIDSTDYINWTNGSSGDIRISSNFVYVNSTKLTALNIPANITLNKPTTTYALPTIMKDNVKCTTCTAYTNLNLPTVEFAVTGFSNYTIGDVPSIVLNYPTSLINYGRVNGTLQLNFTATDSNLDKVWFLYGSELNLSSSMTSPITSDGNFDNYIASDTYQYLNFTGATTNQLIFSKWIKPYSCSGIFTQVFTYDHFEAWNYTSSSWVIFRTYSSGTSCGQRGSLDITNDTISSSFISGGNMRLRYPHRGNLYEVSMGNLRTFNSISGVENLSNITLTTQEYITIYANDTLTNTNTSTFNWDYKVFENSRTYATSLFETATASYAINVTANSSLTAVSLNRNGTLTSMTNYGSGIWNTSVLLPGGSSGNNSISFQFTYDGATINSDTTYQTISTFDFGICNASRTFNVLNITFKDEVTLAAMNATMDSSDWTYSLTSLTTSGAPTKEFSFINATHNLKYQFCANSNATFYSTETVRYSEAVDGTYPQRSITFINEALSSLTPVSKELYLLSYTNGRTSNYQVITVGNQVVAGAHIRVEREIGGVLYQISDGYTDASGQIEFFLNPNYEHTFTITATGFATQSQTIRPSQSQYTITLGTQTLPFSYTNSIEGITYTKWPTSGQIENKGVYNFTFEVYSSLGNKIYNCSMNIRHSNGTILGSATGCITLPTPGTGGKIGVPINVTGIDTNQLFGTYMIGLSNGTYIIESDAQWRLVPKPSGRNYWGTLKGFVNDSINLPEWGSGCNDGFSRNETDGFCYNDDDPTDFYFGQTTDFSRIVFFFLLFAIIMAMLNFYTGYDTAYPGAFIYLMTGIVVIGSMINGPTGIGYFYMPGAISGANPAGTGVFAGFTAIFDNWILAINFLLLSLVYFFTTNKRYSSG